MENIKPISVKLAVAVVCVFPNPLIVPFVKGNKPFGKRIFYDYKNYSQSGYIDK